MRRLLIISFSLLILPGFTLSNAEPKDEKEEYEVTLAIFQYFVPNVGPIGERTFFIGGKTEAETKALLAHFKDAKRPVKAYSEADKSKSGAVIDKATGKPGTMVGLNIESINESKAEVRAWYYTSPLGGTDYRVSLKKIKGRWVIQKIKTLSMS